MYVQSEASFKLPKKELLDLVRKPGALELYHPSVRKMKLLHGQAAILWIKCFILAD